MPASARTGHCVAAAQSERSRGWRAPRARARSMRGDRSPPPARRSGRARRTGCLPRRAGRQGSSRRRRLRPARAGRPPVARRSLRRRVAMREAWLRRTMPAKAPMLPRRASKAGRRRIRSRSRSCRRSSRSARGRPQAAPEARGCGVGLVQQGDKVGFGDRGVHCSAPRSSLSMNRDCRGGSARWWERSGNLVGVWWETPCRTRLAGFSGSSPGTSSRSARHAHRAAAAARTPSARGRSSRVGTGTIRRAAPRPLPVRCG